MVSARYARDDIAVGNHPRASSEMIQPRARSSSPVKRQLRHTSDWPAYIASQNGSLESIGSAASISPEKLLLLSRLPISSRLHITGNRHSIPIPLQIQFPPKLSSQRSSPQLLPVAHTPPRPLSPSKFVFTGQSYEPVSPEPEPKTPTKMNRSSPTELAEPSPTAVQKPPRVIANRRKMARFVQQSNAVPLDQLSMIEEKSASGDSRHTSAESKRLPSLPREQATHPTTEKSEMRPNPEQGIFQRFASSEPIRAKSYLAKELTITEGSSSCKIKDAPGQTPLDSEASSDHDLTLESDSTSVGEIEEAVCSSAILKHDCNEREKPESGGASKESHVQSRKSVMPHPYAFISSPHQLKIPKRSFSDESHVSSVSSFSSIGDVLNFNHAYMLRPGPSPERQPPRSITSFTLNQSSLRTAERGQSTGGIFTPTTQPTSPNLSQLNSPCGNDWIRSEAAKLAESKITSTQSKHAPTVSLQCVEPTAPAQSSDNLTVRLTSISELVHEEVSPLKIRRAAESSDDEDTSVDDNNGAGIGFSFPNNASNCTNSDEARKKAELRRQRPTKSRSSYLFFSDGHIEIPELNQATSSTDAIDEPEPLGVPSSAALKHLKNFYGEGSFNSDSDSSFNSQFSKLNTNPPASKTAQTKCKAPRRSSESPVRHARHRSINNIVFDCESAALPELKHTRSKSSSHVSLLKLPEKSHSPSVSINSSPKKSILKKTSSVNLASRHDTPHIEESVPPLKLSVSDPPTRVSYAVDFKAAEPAEINSDHFYPRMPTDFYQRSKLQGLRSITNSDSYTAENLENASTYQSSKTGGSASTAPTDSGSIIIDLTKENYDICMIKRNDSTTSYRSVMEKTRNGKKVEVVLVDEDEDDKTNDRDDLLSIYSRYMTNWDDGGRLRKSALQKQPLLLAPPRITRNRSTRSNVSDASECLVNSWAASSESNFQVKSLAVKDTRKITVSAPKHTPKKVVIQQDPAPRETNYFDYGNTGSYDFDSYMKQQINL